ncbi:hypothetical protein A3Q56_08284 [Intoshia linei]|uniref:Uncharacterized protein n=1 Tax=Intoshia linei TaxID=1819745 RepID=A0A177AQD2_9BILA|nr:hypothetical protein A3Q56_08284 [Intoshia linei]
MKSRDRSLLADILNSIDNSQLKTFKRLNLQRKNLQETTKNENSITEDIKTLMNSKREECTQTSLKHKFTQCDALHCENFNVDSDQPLKK